MEKKDNINLVLTTQTENSEIQILEDFQSCRTHKKVDLCESGTVDDDVQIIQDFQSPKNESVVDLCESQTGNDEVQIIEDFKSTDDVHLSESPSTSANAKQQKASTSANIGTNAQSEEDTANNATSLDCPICLQSCIYPARLPCGHIFCFLCIKGAAYKNQRCPMCRGEIPAEFLNHPQLINRIDETSLTKCTEDGYQWFYEGQNGWWQYDTRTSQDIEDAFKNEENTCTILVAGHVYIINLKTMVQQRQNEPQRSRRVKRDLAAKSKKGIAGLRLFQMK